MDKFLMISYVAARFTLGELVFEVSAGMRGSFIEAPGWIRNTLLFKWLLKDGSIKVAEEQISKKQGENDPMQGVSAEGKDEKVSQENEEKAEEAAASDEEPTEKPKARKTAKKG